MGLRLAGGLVASSLLLLGVAACSGGEGDNGEGPDPSTTSVAAGGGDVDDPSIIGRWEGDGDQSLVQALSSGLDEPPACSGRSLLELRADGTFEWVLDGVCEFESSEPDVLFNASGTFRSADGSVVLVTETGSGLLVDTSTGEELEVPSNLDSGEAAVPYSVAGDELTLQMGDTSMVFTRA